MDSISHSVAKVEKQEEKGVAKARTLRGMSAKACSNNTSRNFVSGSTKNQQKSVGRGCYLGRVDLDTM
jgi:hypothetical protein